MALTREMVQAMLDSGNFDAVMDELCRHWLATEQDARAERMERALDILHKSREAVAPVIKAERDGQTMPPTGTLFGNGDEKRAADYIENRFGCERWNAEASAKYILSLGAAAQAREIAELRESRQGLEGELSAVREHLDLAQQRFVELSRTRDELIRGNMAFSLRAETAESANRALQAEVDRLSRAVERKNEALVATPCLCKSLPQSTTTYIPQCKRCQAIAYTGTEPQEGT